MSGWIGFLISVLLQLVIYSTLVYRSGSCHQHLAQLPRYLFAGLFVGVVLDYLLGLVLGFWSYDLGFNFPFIALNSFFLWGLFIAEVATFRSLPFLKFGLVCVAIGMISESFNLFVGAWEWFLFANAFIEYLVVIFLLYPAFGMVVALGIKYIEKRQVDIE